MYLRAVCVMSLASLLVSPALADQDATPSHVQALEARSKIRWQDVPPRVLAFYYPWYAIPEVSGRWSHWDGANTAKKEIAITTDYPALGPYDSHDPKTVAQHCAWAKQAGIDGFISSWWSQRDFHDRALPLLLDSAQKHGLEVTIYYERVPRPGDWRSAADDLLYLVRTYGSHPAWLKVQGRPVVFVYGRAMGQLGMLEWAQALRQVERDHAPGVFAVADQLSRSAARVFDGLHTYNTCDRLAGRPLEDVAATVHNIFTPPLADAGRFGRISCVTVIPGYDDTKIRKPGIKAERFDGESYRRQWEAALELNPHWILITSFNEWHEGSEIEPSLEYGDRYLPLTADYAKRFKAQPRRPAPSVADSATTENYAVLRERLGARRIAVLPGAQSEAAYALLDAGLAVDFLSWEQVTSPDVLTVRRYPLLLYAGTEHYVQTVHTSKDVDTAIERYARGGGCIVAMPSLPFPFYYNEKGAAVSSAARFGFLISGGSRADQVGGFESPPADSRLTFTVPGDRLPGVPRSFAFPNAGDRRWRPFMGRQLPVGDDYVPLLELHDQSGRWWGDAVAYAEHKVSQPQGAKVCYVWFRLLDLPQGEAIVRDVLAFLATKLSQGPRP